MSDNCHARWLRQMAYNLKLEGRTAFAHTAEQAADEIEAISRHRDSLQQYHDWAAPQIENPPSLAETVSAQSK